MGLLPRDEEAGNLEPFCRICLGGDDEDDCGHLMTPCNCTGSCEFCLSKFSIFVLAFFRDTGPQGCSIFGVSNQNVSRTVKDTTLSISCVLPVPSFCFQCFPGRCMFWFWLSTHQGLNKTSLRIALFQ
uniref:Uncharacterized protein n=1 Tax=Rhodosorus marinus TaxID=101924 RepID=A0A7S3A7F9_9RHOD|mmetsp:Transcript_44333/g.172448  ORF Transcript_44333/g.172448 Transcript_44333/m.172448 type:complete len:128 (+) Transcript_44333:56-439(+)